MLLARGRCRASRRLLFATSRKRPSFSGARSPAMRRRRNASCSFSEGSRRRGRSSYLRDALGQQRLRPLAQQALARLASAWGVPTVAYQAVEALDAALTDEHASPEVEEALLAVATSRHAAVTARALPLLAKVEQVRAVRLLERLLDDDELGDAARTALDGQLGESSRADVATAARQALGEPPRDIPPKADRDPSRLDLGRAPGSRTSPAELDYHLQSVARAIELGRVVPVLGPGASARPRAEGTSWKRGHNLPTGADPRGLPGGGVQLPDRRSPGSTTSRTVRRPHTDDGKPL